MPRVSVLSTRPPAPLSAAGVAGAAASCTGGASATDGASLLGVVGCASLLGVVGCASSSGASLPSAIDSAADASTGADVRATSSNSESACVVSDVCPGSSSTAAGAALSVD